MEFTCNWVSIGGSPLTLIRNMIKFATFLLLLGCATAEKEYRLPSTVFPEHYKLEIVTHVGDDNNFNFYGKVWIEVNCLESTEKIILHSKDLNIKENEITVKDISGSDRKTLKISNFEKNKSNDFFIINLSEKLQDTHKYEIFVPFDGELNDGLAGYYRSSYEDKATKQKRWIAATQFEATDARRAFPCFDEPAMKATFQISLGRMKKYSTLSNMPILKTEPMKEKEGWYWDRYETSVPMSTYLVAFVVSDFDYKVSEPSKDNNVTFKIWARKDAINQVEFAREVGPQFLSYYEKFFDIPYPLPKQDMIALPDFSSGAMENWGLITYREPYLLFDPNISSSTSQHSVSSVIAHELAHQWFGNLVTMKWWTDLWLNEGFATYMSSLAVHHLFPQWNSLKEEACDNLLNVFSFDALKSSHPVSVPIGHPNEIDQIFDTISYKKGSFLIRMMGHFLGEKTLREGVSSYLQEHKYNNAEQDDLWHSLTKKAHSDGVLPKNLTVKTIMDTWTVQTGYPVVNVKRDYSKKMINMRQERFLKDTIKSPLRTSPCWWVPISYTVQNEKDFNQTRPKHWLCCSEDTQKIPDEANENEWIIFNVQVSGLYKVNYDEKNWKLLTDTLNSENYRDIAPLNRVQLIGDSADLAWVGDLNYDVFFNIINYLKQEDEYLPWKSGLSNIADLDKLLRRSPNYGLFKIFMKRLLTPIYEKIGGFTQKRTNLNKLDSVKHQILIVSWSCKFEVANCVTDSTNLFKAWHQNKDKENPIPKDFRRIVYCTAIKYGGEKEWDYLWKYYRNSNVGTEKQAILSALGCSKEVWILSRYLEWSITDNSGIRRQDSPSVFHSVVGREVGFYIAKNFFFENVKKVHDHLAPNTNRLARYLVSIASQMSNDKDLAEFQNFIKNNTDYLKDAKQGTEQALETVKLNIQWQNRHHEDIKKLLTKHVKEN